MASKKKAVAVVKEPTAAALKKGEFEPISKRLEGWQWGLRNCVANIRDEQRAAEAAVEWARTKAEFAEGQVKLAVEAMLEGEPDEKIRELLNATYEASLLLEKLKLAGGWQKLQEEGASDQRIIEQLQKWPQFGNQDKRGVFVQRGYGRDGRDLEMRVFAGKLPLKVFEIKGKALVGEARKLLGIPAAKVAPKPAKKAPAVKKKESLTEAIDRLSSPQARGGKAAGGVAFRPQTFNQWLSTVRGIIGPSNILDIKGFNADPAWKERFERGMKPSEARDEWKKTLQAVPVAVLANVVTRKTTLKTAAGPITIGEVVGGARPTLATGAAKKGTLERPLRPGDLHMPVTAFSKAFTLDVLEKIGEIRKVVLVNLIPEELGAVSEGEAFACVGLEPDGEDGEDGEIAVMRRMYAVNEYSGGTVTFAGRRSSTKNGKAMKLEGVEVADAEGLVWVFGPEDQRLCVLLPKGTCNPQEPALSSSKGGAA